jgi:hypothetical protein
LPPKAPAAIIINDRTLGGLIRVQSESAELAPGGDLRAHGGISC